MSLCDNRGLFATDKEMARGRSRSCVEGIDAVSHKKHRLACRRINQCFHKAANGFASVLVYHMPT